eukprot:snap_masked-scaffold_20-processed-gene-1.21-mRNA-1 protein AED:1.00 eAED:1.00 QI:0/0/0/0/1/1/2/0/96
MTGEEQGVRKQKDSRNIVNDWDWYPTLRQIKNIFLQVRAHIEWLYGASLINRLDAAYDPKVNLDRKSTGSRHLHFIMVDSTVIFISSFSDIISKYI